MSEQQKDEKPKEECCEKQSPDFQGFHGFGPRCNGLSQMFGRPPCYPHKHKERKCECGEIIPKRKEGEPKIKACPKCGKDLPKKNHGFGMRCHKMKKIMKLWNILSYGRGLCMGLPQWSPECWQNPYCPPLHHQRGLEVHHYIHFGPPQREELPPHFGPPPIRRPPCFGPSPMGRDSCFGAGLMGQRQCFGARQMGPPPCFRSGSMGNPQCLGPCDKLPSESCGKESCENLMSCPKPCQCGENCTCEEDCGCRKEFLKECTCGEECPKPCQCKEDCECKKECPIGNDCKCGDQCPCPKPPYKQCEGGSQFQWGMWGRPPFRGFEGPLGRPLFGGFGGPYGRPPFGGFGGLCGRPPCGGYGFEPCRKSPCQKKCGEKKCDKKGKEPEAKTEESK